MACMIFLFLVGLFVFGFIASLIIIHHPGPTRGSRKTHSSNHPGLTKHGKDVICPKCKSPHCQYYFEERLETPNYIVKNAVIPGTTYQLQRFRCTNCGYIFD